MTRSLLLLPLSAVLAAWAPAQDIQGPTLTPRSFSVVRSDAEKKGFGDRDHGTRVGVRVEVPGRKVIAVDTNKSKLDSFVDDKNFDLLAGLAAQPGFAARWITADNPVSGKPGDVAFQVPGCPSMGATKVRIKGKVIVTVGKGEKEIEKKDQSMKTGVDLGFGTLKQRTSPFGRADGPRSNSLVYEGTKPILSVTLLDGDGKEIPSRINPFSSARPPGAGENPQYRVLLTVTGKTADSLTVKVKYFEGTEEITVPVDLEVGPGL